MFATHLGRHRASCKHGRCWIWVAASRKLRLLLVAASVLLQELPAANLNAFWLLLELGNRIAAEAATNEMDERALGAALAPVLAWHAPPPKTLEKVGASMQMTANSTRPYNAQGRPRAHQWWHCSPCWHGILLADTLSKVTQTSSISPNPSRKYCRSLLHLQAALDSPR